jgi:hypothetical protein
MGRWNSGGGDGGTGGRGDAADTDMTQELEPNSDVPYLEPSRDLGTGLEPSCDFGATRTGNFPGS